MKLPVAACKFQDQDIKLELHEAHATHANINVR